MIHEQEVVLTASREGKIAKWSKQFESLGVIQTGISRLTSMALSPDQKFLALSALGKSFSSNLQFWSVDEGKWIRTIDFPAGISHEERDDNSLHRETSTIRKVLFSEDGSKIFLLGSTCQNTQFTPEDSFRVTLNFAV